MKQIILSADEVIPLSKRQFLILLIIIACLFQFVFFAAPTLANAAINNSNNEFVNTPYLEIKKDFDLKIEFFPIFIDNESIKDVFQIKYGATINENDSIYYGPNPEPTIIYQGNLYGYQQALPEALELHKIISASYHTLTAYNSDPAQTDDTPCITANGFDLCEHDIEDTIAANFLTFGTKVMIPELFGDRIFIVRDRMNKRFPLRVDVWMKDYNEAKTFGVKYAKIYVIE